MNPLSDIPALYITVIVFLIIIYLAREKYLPRAPKENQHILRKSIFNYKLSMGNPLKTILLPFLALLLLNGIYPATNEPAIGIFVALFAFPLMVILQPLMEEIIFRGIVFGGFITLSEKMKRSRFLSTEILISGLMIQSFFFMLLHGNVNLPTFINGIVYAVFFYFPRRRNLLPCWAAHSSHNLLTLLAQLGLFKVGWIWALF